MSNCPQAMTPASIRYLLVLDDLCREGRGVRSVEFAVRMNVSKPSAHSMLQNLCQAGLVEKERYGTVFLTPEGFPTFPLPTYPEIKVALEASNTDIAEEFSVGLSD